MVCVVLSIRLGHCVLQIRLILVANKKDCCWLFYNSRRIFFFQYMNKWDIFYVCSHISSRFEAMYVSGGDVHKIIEWICKTITFAKSLSPFNRFHFLFSSIAVCWDLFACEDQKHTHIRIEYTSKITQNP